MNPNMYMTGMMQPSMGMNSFGNNSLMSQSNFNPPDPKIKESFAKDGFKV
jgi:hypothetical protein